MRRGELIANMAIMFGIPLLVIPIFISVSVSIVGSSSHICFWMILSLLFIGFILFLKAKLSLIKKGRLFTFGIKGMTKGNRALYISGYILMLLGFILSLGFLMYASMSTN